MKNNDLGYVYSELAALIYAIHQKIDNINNVIEKIQYNLNAYECPVYQVGKDGEVER